MPTTSFSPGWPRTLVATETEDATKRVPPVWNPPVFPLLGGHAPIREKFDAPRWEVILSPLYNPL